MAKRILLVEDEESILDAIKLNLEAEGYEVDVATDGEAAVKSFRSARYHLVILDVMIPKIDGFTVCQTIRLEDTRTPILFLTAKNAAQDRIQGLKLGGDDYLTKPFNLEEFLLRVGILLKRAEDEVPSNGISGVFTFGKNSIDFSTYEITTTHGDKKTLSAREIRLLKLMIDRKNQVVSRELILETVWGYDVYPSTRTIDNYILAFRKYFEENPKAPRYFHSIRGVGYKFSHGKTQ